MASFATYKPWVNRKGPQGRVRIWDTESWVANTDDRVAAVIAANRSAGYDRAMGIYGGNIHEGQNAWSVGRGGRRGAALSWETVRSKNWSSKTGCPGSWPSTA